MSDYINSVLNNLNLKYPHEQEFLQATEEVLSSLSKFIENHKKYEQYSILERIVEPERIISFKVEWVDDSGKIQVNNGYRVQFNSAIGPYKGGLRFHPSVNQSVLKFLGFEQTFKNSLTGLPLGGGKGGSNFDPKGKSENEIMRFSQAFMNELFRHIGANIDVPAGDIGVGAREIGYMFGRYKKIANSFEGVLTGKGIDWGGSHIRPEATGYGVVYFTEEMLNHKGDSLKNKSILISGSGNVAQYTVEKAIELGANVITMSDSSGVIYDQDGIDEEKLEFIKDLKNEKRGRIKEYAEKYNVEYFEEKKPWGIEADVAIPAATQNEITQEDANQLVRNGIMAVIEGANMPSTKEAIDTFRENNILFAPGKASNAGGVAASGLEMSQNSLRMQWSRKKVDDELKLIMKDIHKKIVAVNENNEKIDYLTGANIAGFKKVADAMIEQGV